MKTQMNVPIPVMKSLRKLGQDISDARRRRHISVQLMTERADISKNTLMRIEKGEPSVSIGSYASVLFVIGMSERLADIADGAHDLTGRRLEEERLPKRVHLPKRR